MRIDPALATYSYILGMNGCRRNVGLRVYWMLRSSTTKIVDYIHRGCPWHAWHVATHIRESLRRCDDDLHESPGGQPVKILSERKKVPKISNASHNRSTRPDLRRRQDGGRRSESPWPRNAGTEACSRRVLVCTLIRGPAQTPSSSTRTSALHLLRVSIITRRGAKHSQTLCGDRAACGPFCPSLFIILTLTPRSATI
jgi:hypothetical protein